MKRRDFITKTGVGVAAGVVGAATLSAPAIADGHKEINIVSTWPRDFPGLGLSAQRLAARITELSNGKLKCNYFAAGEKSVLLMFLMKLHQVILKLTLLLIIIGKENILVSLISHPFHLE